MGEKTGPNPTDRGKRGAKRSLMTDAAGVPIAAVIDGANRHDMKLLEATLDAIVPERPEPDVEHPQGLCLDKGYDYGVVRELVEGRGFEPHIRSRGEEARAVEHGTDPPRRWVVERTHSWLNRNRALLTRWTKDPARHQADTDFACGLLAFQRAGVYG